MVSTLHCTPPWLWREPVTWCPRSNVHLSGFGESQSSGVYAPLYSTLALERASHVVSTLQCTSLWLWREPVTWCLRSIVHRSGFGESQSRGVHAPLYIALALERDSYVVSTLHCTSLWLWRETVTWCLRSIVHRSGFGELSALALRY